MDIQVEVRDGDSFYVVGENPTTTHIGGLIDGLHLNDDNKLCFPGTNTPFEVWNEVGDPASIGSLTFETKTLGATTYTRTDILNNIETMLGAIQEDEAGSHQFKEEGDFTWTTVDGYPLWELKPGGVQGPGVGLCQLTQDPYKYRATIWDWRKNLGQAAFALYWNFRRTCTQLSSHVPTLEDGYVTSVYPAVSELTLGKMVRLGSYSRFNGGTGSAGEYHVWNSTGPQPVLASMTRSAWATATAIYEQHAISPTATAEAATQDSALLLAVGRKGDMNL